MSACINWYLRTLKTHPLKTHAITTGALMFSGDVICQTVIEKKSIQNIEHKRVARFAILGAFFVGPSLFLWYSRLEKIFGTTGASVGLKKMLLDQSCFAPSILCGIITLTGLLQRQQWSSIENKLRQEYFSILKTNYMIWPATQLVTFYVIPFHLRVLFVNTVALFWNTYLAAKTNKTT